MFLFFFTSLYCMSNDDMLFHRFLNVKSAVLWKGHPKDSILRTAENGRACSQEFSIVPFLFLIFNFFLIFSFTNSNF